MGEIHSLTAHYLMRLGQRGDRHATACAAFLAAAGTPLRGFQRPDVCAEGDR
jgi:hypothetical protein